MAMCTPPPLKTTQRQKKDADFVWPPTELHCADVQYNLIYRLWSVRQEGKIVHF